MIRENQKILNTAQILLDIIIFLFSMSDAYFLRFVNYTGQHIQIDFYLKISIIAIPIYVLIFNYFQLYESYRTKRLSLEIRIIIKANSLGIILIVILSFLFKEVNISRMVIMIFGVINTSLMILIRVILRKTLRTMRSKGYNIKRMLIIGYNGLAMEFVQKILTNKNLGYDVVGFLSNKYDGYDSASIFNLIPYKGRFADLEKVTTGEAIDEVIVALEYDQYDHLPDIIEVCEKAGTKISIIPFYTKYIPARPYIDEVEGLPVDRGRELRVPVEPGLPETPVVPRSPVLRQVPNVAERHAVLVADPGQLVGPAGASEPIVQVVEVRLRDLHPERKDPLVRAIGVVHRGLPSSCARRDEPRSV